MRHLYSFSVSYSFLSVGVIFASFWPWYPFVHCSCDEFRVGKNCLERLQHQSHRLSQYKTAENKQFSIETGDANLFRLSGKTRAPNSWGYPSNSHHINSSPQVRGLPTTNLDFRKSHENIWHFPCSTVLERELDAMTLKLRLAVDHNWDDLLEAGTVLFRQDVTTLANVMRSEFEREKVLKNAYSEFV